MSKEKFISKFEALNQINDLNLDLFKKGKSIENYNTKDVFNELVDLSLKVFKNSKGVDVITKLKKFSYGAIDEVAMTLSYVLLSKVRQNFFVEDGICGHTTTIPDNKKTIRIKPKEFDLFDLFKTNPNSPLGVMLYEDNTDRLERFHTEMFNTFLGQSYHFNRKNGSELFNVEWDENNQEFIINIGELDIRRFIDDYYNRVSFPSFRNIVERGFINILKYHTTFDKKTLHFDKLLEKIFSICNSNNQDKTSTGINQDLFNQNFDALKYFDNSGEHSFNNFQYNIDLYDGRRFDRVITFDTCYQLSIDNVNDIVEEFNYFNNKGGKKQTRRDFEKQINDLVDKVSVKSHFELKGEISIPKIKGKFILDFIRNIPKVLISQIFAPKYLFPIVLIYKVLYNGAKTLNYSDILKTFSKLFLSIIMGIFWNFINIFWRKIKGELMKILNKITSKSLRKKIKRYITILLALISLIRKIDKTKIKDCNSMYDIIIKAINVLLSVNRKTSIPNILLLLSDRLPGFSQDRAFLNIIEMVNNMGISTAPIYGEDNNLTKTISAIIDGYTNEVDENGYVKVVLKGGTVPATSVNAIIPPGVLTGVGKMF